MSRQNCSGILALICFLAAVALLMCGCIFGPTTVDAESPNEEFAVAVAHQHAKEMGTWVDPQITTNVCTRNTSPSCNTDVPAAAWVPNGGKSHDIYIWKVWVNDTTLDDIRAKIKHEVEHVACQCRLGED